MYFKLNEQTKKVHWMYSATVFKKSIYLLLLYLCGRNIHTLGHAFHFFTCVYESQEVK